MKFAHAIAIALLSALVGCAPASPRSPRIIVQSHQTMGSELRVTLWTSKEGEAYTSMAAVFEEVDRLDRLLSVWKPDSDVTRINSAAGRSAVVVSRETIDLVRTARQVSEWTHGKFDITFGALADVWKFDHDRNNRVPAAADIAARLPLIDYKAIEIDDVAGTVFVSRPRMRVHLGGIGKGYAVDRAVTMLRAAGLHDFMVQFGGDLYVSGESDVGPWRLGISDPRGAADDSFATVVLRDRTLSTSGDYERSFVQDGQRYHHIIDPDTGQPARGCVSVTVVARNAVLADALSTGVFLLGPTDGMALVERLPDVDAVIVAANNDVLISSGLRGQVELLHPPTATRP